MVLILILFLLMGCSQDKINYERKIKHCREQLEFNILETPEALEGLCQYAPFTSGLTVTKEEHKYLKELSTDMGDCALNSTHLNELCEQIQ